MLTKLFNREPLVELDNIIDNVIVLAECFVANEMLKPKSEIMARYKESGEPLSLDVRECTLVGEDVECRGTILDKENRVIANMLLKFENGRVKHYEIVLKGRLKGKKISITENTDKVTATRRCCVLDVINTLQRLTATVKEKKKC